MSKAERLSPAQREALTGLAEGRIGREWNGVEHSYIPPHGLVRTYDLLAERGLIRWQQLDAVTIRISGYVITDAGRAAIAESSVCD